jgi:outer membrane scaffolding protein for murein synthesis (MipA/OmpV family)
MRTIAKIAGLIALPLSATAFAQSAVVPEDSVLDGDYLTVGVGAIYGPSYEGSDDYVVTPVPVVQGRLKGVDITPRPGGAALDFVPDGKDAKLGFSLGPVATYSRNRNWQIKDPVVESLGKLDSALNLGVNAGVTVYRLLHDYDSFTASADVKWDLTGAHGATIVTPQISYFTPLSRGALVTVNVSAKHVDGDYADYYYTVTPDQSVASGLPQFDAKGGWTSVGAGFLAGFDLDGNLLNGGLAIVLLGSYNRLMNEAKRTPFTSIRGDADQWLIGAGVGYTF